MEESVYNDEQKSIFNVNIDELKTRLSNGELIVSVIGIGRIGLPTALSFADAGFHTIGVDINTKLVEMINSEDYPLKDEPYFDKIFEKVIKNKKFHAVTDIAQAINQSDIVILSLPTPMNNSNIPDYSALISVGKDIGKIISKKILIIVESTVEPNFIENELLTIIESSNNKKSGVDFELAVCPETANPGEIMNDFKKLPRLVGAVKNEIAPIVSEIYSHVFGVEMIPMPNCKTANAVKLTTNVFRDVNIAFVNELSLLFEKLGIDTFTVIDAAKRKYNFQPHFPGPGVGGPCLPVNSYQFLNSSIKANSSLNIVSEARRINESMSEHVIEMLTKVLQEQNKSLVNANIAILGISYKPNVRDVQIAPSEKILSLLKEKKCNIKIFDPFFPSTTIFSLPTEKNIEEAITNADACIIITGHNDFRDLNLNIFTEKMSTPILVDCTGIIDYEKTKNLGIIFRGIGRGKSQ